MAAGLASDLAGIHGVAEHGVAEIVADPPRSRPGRAPLGGAGSLQRRIHD
jgi:hypothetical protein